MATRSRRNTRTDSPENDSGRIDSLLFSDDELDLEDMSEDELEELFFDEEKPSSGFFNLPTIAGFSLILVGIAYIFQMLGLAPGVDLSVLAAMLPWMAGILIILLGFGVLSWRPGRKSKKKKNMSARDRRAERAAEKAESRLSSKEARTEARKARSEGRPKLRKTRDKKLMGVAGGIANYFNIDPTLVRIAFVIGTIASGGPFLLAYFILGFVMPNPEKHTFEERITIIRDS
ncbi:MAG: phage shock protein C [Rhodothermales bacterium]|jgi:phage shock protein C